MSLQLLLIIAFGSSLVTYILGKLSQRLRDIFAVIASWALVVMVAIFYGKQVENTSYLKFLDMNLILRLDTLSWLFAITITVVGALSIIFALSYIKMKERTDFFYLMMLLVNASMLGIVLSGDLASFYIFWEIMSWSAFLLISYNRGPALAAGMKYIVMSILGSVAMLVAVLSLYGRFGTLVISELAPAMTSASSGYILFLLLLFFTSFGVKNAVLPFHTWLPDAHSEAPSPFSAVLSGILIKMGTYGFFIVIYAIVGLKIFLGLGQGILSFHYILSIVGAITIIIPSFIAVLQNDAKRLLAWSTVGQAGYIILGIAYGTSLSVTSGLFHFVNHAAFKALLFMVVGAVEYRTGGVRDLNSLGGLIKKMPVTFIGAIVGVCGLIGVPLTNGFVSKWLIYKTLILEGSPLLAFAALIGTWGTILYSYKLIHNIFLGQLPVEYKEIKDAPISMQVPMVIFSLVIVTFGVLPGVPLRIINNIISSLGFEPLNVSLWGIVSETGALNTINISVAVIIAGIIAWLIYRAGKSAVRVSQDDNYAAGAYVPVDKYSYTVDFYNPLYRIVSPFLKDYIDIFYVKLTGWTRKFCGKVRLVYTGDVGNYVMYIMSFIALLIFIQLTWGVWK
jgi:formate hydrogenlyase subunit 3/multisubunit Na+/H+ antiporter MnhD subunit